MAGVCRYYALADDADGSWSLEAHRSSGTLLPHLVHPSSLCYQRDTRTSFASRGRLECQDNNAPERRGGVRYAGQNCTRRFPYMSYHMTGITQWRRAQATQNETVPIVPTHSWYAINARKYESPSEASGSAITKFPRGCQPTRSHGTGSMCACAKHCARNTPYNSSFLKLARAQGGFMLRFS